MLPAAFPIGGKALGHKVIFLQYIQKTLQVADELFYLLNEAHTEKIYLGYYFPWTLDFL